MQKSSLALSEVWSERDPLPERISPNFISNMLRAVAAHNREHPEQAERTTTKLGLLLRDVLKVRKRTVTSVGSAVILVRAYIELEKSTLRNSLSYELHVSESLLNVKIPAMLLLPLLENAIEHRIRAFDIPGHLILRIFAVGSICQIEVTDQGVVDVNHQLAAEGIQLVLDCLSRHYPSRYQFELMTARRPRRTTARIRIPLIHILESSDGKAPS